MRAAVFLPCTTSITAEGVVQLYMEHVYCWFGLPHQGNIRQRPTVHLTLCSSIVWEATDTTKHFNGLPPQTDGLSEQRNQWIKQFLRLVTNAQQEEWKQWLPIAMAVHNNYINATTQVILVWALLEYLPTLNPMAPLQTKSDQVEWQVIEAFKSWE